MFQFLQNRSTYGRYSRGNTESLDLSFVLRKFKNYSNDSYTISDDDGMSVPPMACAFAKTHQNGNVLSVVDEDGYIVLSDANKAGPANVKSNWRAHANAIFDVSWAEADKQLMTASGDQTIALWEVEGQRKVDVFKGHTSSVKSVSIRFEDEAVFASGSRDGHIMLWDKRIFHKEGTIPPVDTIYNAHAVQQNVTPGKPRRKKMSSLQPKDGQQSVTAVLFQDNNYLVSCGAVDGCIKVWDIRKTYKLFAAGALPVQTFHYPGSSLRKHGFSCLTLDDSRSRLFASCTDDNIYEYNMKSDHDRPVHSFRGHRNSTFYVKTAISPDNQYLLSGSSNNHAYIWQVNKREAPPILLKAHDAEVTSVAWSPIDLTKVVTLSDDAKTKVWRIYCREQKSSLLPHWLGRARRFSKEKSTSMMETPPHFNWQIKQNLNTPSPTHSPLNSKTQSTSKPSTPKSVHEWLKRKSTKEISSCDEASASKVLREISECTSHIVDKNKNATPRKRPHSDIDESKDSSYVDVNSQCASTHDGDRNDIVLSKRFKESCENSDPSSNESTDTPKREKDNKSTKHSSPRKLFKRSLELEGSPTKSPKRSCLTPVKDNGQCSEPVERNSVKISLFADTTSSKHNSSKESQEFNVSKKVDNVNNQEIVKGKGDGDFSNSSSQYSEESLTPLKQKLKQCCSDDGDHDSPTRNLPNLVMDQLTNLRPTSPLLSTSSQMKKLDWLTQLKINKGKKGSESSEKNLPVASGGSTKSSPKVSNSAKMKKIHAYFKAQNGNQKSEDMKQL